MARRIIEANRRSYTVALDDEVPLVQRLWGIVRARVVDELTQVRVGEVRTNRSPGSPVRLKTQTKGFTPRVTSDGLLGLMAIPAGVFPRLAEQDYEVRFSIFAGGYIPHHVAVTFPVNPQFPIRTISADPNPGDSVLTLGSVESIAANETLLVGRPGNRERVRVQSVDPALQRVMIDPQLANDHNEGDPIIVEQFVPFDPGTIVIDLGEIPLHREPVVIAGRVRRRIAGTLTPVSGATVEVTAIWPPLVPPDVEPSPEPPNVVSLDPPLYVARTVAAGRLRRREMTPVVGEDKELLAFAHAGDRRLHLSDKVNLDSGDIVLIDADPAIQEFVTIGAPPPVGAEDLPTTITLTHPLAYLHRRGTLVRKVVPQAPGPDLQLGRDAIAGETCLFLDSLGGLNGVEVVEVHGGSAPAEFHRLHLFTAVSDADGQYRLPLLSRVARLELEATEGGDTTGPITFIPNYLNRENRLDIEF